LEAKEGAAMKASQELKRPCRLAEVAIGAAVLRAAETRRFVELARRLPEVRVEKVRRVRSLIAQGKLETPECIEGAVRRLIEELDL
jgi:hypothetical protein